MKARLVLKYLCRDGALSSFIYSSLAAPYPHVQYSDTADPSYIIDGSVSMEPHMLEAKEVFFFLNIFTDLNVLG